MRACSASTRISDPYRAGVALGNALADIHPEVIFLFTSIHYPNPQLMLDGLYETLENEQLVVIGCSGDGFLEARTASDNGAAALGLNSDGALQWKVMTSDKLKANPATCTRTAIGRLRDALGAEPDLVFLASDFDADASQIEMVLHDEVRVPVVGGYAADDNQMQGCFIYANRAVIHDSIAMLGVSGGLRYRVRVGNTLITVGKPAIVDAADRQQLLQIGGQSAVDFIAEQTGKPVLQTDRGIVSLRVTNPDESGEQRTRAIVPGFSQDEGTLGLYGGIETGMQVQVCLADPAQLVDDVVRIVNELSVTDAQPKAALIVSCAGRKWLHGSQIVQETQILNDRFPGGLPVAGFCSFGEIAPLQHQGKYTRNLFHNMTYVLLLID